LLPVLTPAASKAPCKVCIHAVMFAVGMTLLVVTMAGTWLLAVDTGGSLIRNGVRLALAWYFTSVALMLYMQPPDWAATTRLGRIARWCWTWAILGFVLHVGLAFHYFHHWSHAHAVAHTREVAGIGEGIYVTYLFLLLWAADAVDWLLRPQARAVRPAWIGRTLHAFMLFIIFNGVVVYEDGPIRWVGGVAFVGLIGLWLAARRRDPARSGSLSVAPQV
jgi:hypothetical protein